MQIIATFPQLDKAYYELVGSNKNISDTKASKIYAESVVPRFKSGDIRTPADIARVLKEKHKI